ncbi:hypothetical protein QVD17_36600 [Tagetes erecta]|uniref:Uncharacterized protein n=1 Tax=Tagetes erecta TaxID=13708 RepID=A0AAD8JWP5_TARER|nr:hypothetical protein QVD17_36600 [Tagetes erecta]
MKREGRQHGVVRTFPMDPYPFLGIQRSLKTVDAASVAGIFTKVSTKPTNHSKFTGKCYPGCFRCHVRPLCKSKDKAKATLKLKTIGSDRGLIGCVAGTSVTDALAYLANDGSCDHDDQIDDYDYDEEYKDEFGIEVENEEEEEEEEDDDWYLVE